MQLILFDIDQTLMETGGVGMRCLRAAARDELGVEAFEGVRPDGKTDPQILLEGLHVHGFGESDFQRVLRRYADILRHELANPDPRRRLKPGVQQLLDKLAGLPPVGLGLLTGNLQATAWLKLQALHVEHYFPVGAFGSDSAFRNDLGPIAVRRAEEHYRRRAESTWVIGDTPMDIEAARATPAHVLAVATGSHDRAALVAAGADAVLPDLSDLPTVLHILGLDC